MVTDKEVNGVLAEVSTSAYKYKSAPVRRLLIQSTSYTPSSSGTKIPFNLSTAVGDLSLLNTAKGFIAPVDGLYSISVNYAPRNATGNTYLYFFHQLPNDTTKKTYKFPYTSTDDSSPSASISIYLLKDEYIQPGYYQGYTFGPVWFDFALIEKKVPDVYAEKFATGESDLDNKVLITSVTTNADVSFTLTEASYILVRGQGTQPSASGAIAFDLYKDVKDADHFVHSQMVYTTRHGYVALIYVPAGNYIMATDAQSAILRSVYRVPLKKISVTRPQVIALPCKVDFIDETQTGYYETSAGVFKPKYQRAVLNVAIPVISAGNWGNSTTAWPEDNVIIKPSTWYGTSDGAGWAVATRANGGFLSFFLHSTWSATTIPRVTVEYIKTSDPTYTWDQILAMEPQA